LERADVLNSHGRFVWYELSTTDLKAAAAFYTKVMGWGVWDASVPGRPCILFSDGKISVSGLTHLPEDARERGAKPSWTGYVGVDDVDAAVDRIKRLGGAVHVPPTNVADISRFAIFADPQAARLALFKWLKPQQERSVEPGARGHVGWHELLATDQQQAWDFYGDLFGWQKTNADVEETGTYQLFSAAGQTIGGMLTKPSTMTVPFWLYYFNSGDIDATARRVTAAGGQIVDGPVEIPGGTWIVQCSDPQGAMFALQGKRSGNAVGYFERVASPGPSGARGRTWSW
jgi:predicted enzyme related to lactoylglutathione lyase